MTKRLTRRDFIRSAAIAGGLAASVPVLEACAAAVPTPTAITLPPTPTPITLPPTPTAAAAVPTPTAITLPPTPTPITLPPTPTAITLPPTPTATPLVRMGPWGMKPGVVEVAVGTAEGHPAWFAQQQFNAWFAEDHPGVEVKNIITGDPAQATALKLRVEEGNPPEVMGFGSTTNIAYYKDLEKKGMLYDMTEVVNSPSYDSPGKTLLDTILPQVRDHMFWEGRAIGVIHSAMAMVTFYNEDLFAKAGLPKTPPKTFSQLIEYSEKLKAAGIIPMAGDWGFPALWTYMTERVMGREAFEDWLFNRAAFETVAPGLLLTAQLMRQLIDVAVSEGFLGEAAAVASTLHVQEKAAMYHSYSGAVWRGKEYRNFNVVDVFSFPEVEGGKGNPANIVGYTNVYNVAANSKRPELGAEYLRFWSSRRVQDYMIESWDASSVVIGTKVPKTRARITTLRLMKEAPAIIPWDYNLGAYEPELNIKLNEVRDKFFVKGLTPEEYIQEADKIHKEYWAKKKA